MNDSIRLGSVHGVRIGVHWSVAIAAWLLAWGLATRVLPDAAPLEGTGAHWVAAATVAVAFFASLLAHELAHAFCARRSGIVVEGVTLWLLGGVARLRGEVESASDELRIAVAGPLVSFGLALLCGAAAAALSALDSSPLLTEGLGWLARVNLIIAAFNLLPGAPLDGGRIVRALAWRLGRDRLRAALLATSIGRHIGFALALYGALELLVSANLGGLWFILIGLFMTATATAEAARERARAALAGVRVRDVMVVDPRRLPTSLTADVLIDAVLRAEQRSHAVTVDMDGQIIGVVGTRELAGLSTSRRREVRVGTIAVPLERLPRVSADEMILIALAEADTAAGYLVVVDEGQIVGILAVDDVARYIESDPSVRAMGGSPRERPGAPRHGPRRPG